MSTSLTHLALIPDGNRRWAREHHLPVLAGHHRVVEKVFPELIEKALALQIKYFTIWAFSPENWQRDEQEVSGLLKIAHLFAPKFGEKLHQKGIRLTFMGRTDNLDPKLLHLIDEWTTRTANNQNLTLNIAFNYGGRDEIVRAVNRLLRQDDIKEIGESTFANYLDTSIFNLPDPDLIIRTSGEKRLSGFMSWQSAYSELYFSQKLMPDWTGDDLQTAVDDFYARDRRYGK